MKGDILKDQSDPDIAYNQLIRPWKSRLGIFYIENRSILIDMKLIWLTVIAVLSREKALETISSMLSDMKAEKALVTIALRREALVPTPPPGTSKIVTNREGRVDD